MTGLLREFYDFQLELQYRVFPNYTPMEKGAIVDNDYLKPHYIDMLNSQKHVREFLKSITKGAAEDKMEHPLYEDILWHNNYFTSIFQTPEDMDSI